MLLDQLPIGQQARIGAIDWDAFAEPEGRRLRALGIDEGAMVSILHRGIFFGRDPLAVKIGRMTVAVRRMHARHISVDAVEEAVAG
ncbi:MAG: FeoA family protein [Blastomonas sp.]